MLPADPDHLTVSRMPLIAVSLVTPRRHGMLRRWLSRVLGQTHRDLVVKVVNDDPDHHAVGQIVRSFEMGRNMRRASSYPGGVPERS
jgi:hypothetical protein